MNILISFRCMCSIYLWRNKPNSIKLDLLEGIAEDGYDYKCEFVTKYIYSNSIPSMHLSVKHFSIMSIYQTQ